MSEFKEIKEFLKKTRRENIHFQIHALERMKDRPISKGMITKSLKANTLQHVEKQTDGRYKAWFKLSNRYSLVLIIRKTDKNLYIITGWNTSRKWRE